MTFDGLRKSFTRSGALALAAYAGAALLLAATLWTTLAGLADSYADYRGAQERLAALAARKPAGGESGEDPGSPFLDGPTVTVAGADLQRRVAEAVTAAGGNVLSSQIDLQGSQANEGFVLVSTNFEVAQDALQPLLYDLEAGAPLLFVEQLVVQSPLSAGAQSAAEGRKMRVQIDVAGQWQVRK
ncbi:type II secretion system protein GspM [Methylocella sp.]|uniref:type II secretion system protein GspM n=1 Tax=Methylocella sp. TaxID=1978226 RepID=UPI0035AE2DF1